MSQEELIKSNQKTFKQSFKRNYKIYQEIMNSINVNLKLIENEEEIIKDFLDSQHKNEKKAVKLAEEIKLFLAKWKEKKTIVLKENEQQDYITFAKAQKQLNDLYNIDEKLLNKEEKNTLLQKHDYLQRILDNFTILQLAKFQSYYDYCNEVGKLSADFVEMIESLKDLNKTIQDYKREVNSSILINTMRKENVTKQKIEHLNLYVQKIRKNYNKFTPINKMLYSGKMKRVEENENRMTF